MALYVQKYGGTSVGSVERIEAVADKVARFRAEGHDIVVVVSAMSGETNRLIGLAKDIQEAPNPREMDVLVSTGEQVTIALLSMALNKRGVAARSYTGGQVKILTDSSHTKARIQDIEVESMREDLNADVWLWSRASRGSTTTATSPRWGVAGPILRVWPWPQLCGQTSVRSIPMWMAYTRPIRAWWILHNVWIRSPLRDAGDGQPGF